MQIVLLFILYSGGTAFVFPYLRFLWRPKNISYNPWQPLTYIESSYSEYRKRNGMDHRYSPNSTKHMEEMHKIYKIFRADKTLRILMNPTIPDYIKLQLIENNNITPLNISAGGLDDF